MSITGPTDTGHAHTVLLADDDDQLRASLGLFLREHGYRVVEVRDGREAIACLDLAGDTIALVVLDLAMPVMDGWAFLAARRASASMSRIPTIVLSETPAMDPRCHNLPVTLYCAKPFRFEFLAALMDSVLESAGEVEYAPARRSAVEEFQHRRGV